MSISCLGVLISIEMFFEGEGVEDWRWRDGNLVGLICDFGE